MAARVGVMNQSIPVFRREPNNKRYNVQKQSGTGHGLEK